MNYFGLDVSSSVIGISVLDDKENLLHYQSIIFDSKKQSHDQRMMMFYEIFKTLVEQYNPEKCFVESPAMNFGKASTANTMAVLQKINGIVTFLIFLTTGKSAGMINVASGRAGLKIRLPRVKGMKSEEKKKLTKKIIVAWVKDKYPEFKVELTKQGNLKKGIDDQADSIVVCLSGIRGIAEDVKDES